MSLERFPDSAKFCHIKSLTTRYIREIDCYCIDLCPCNIDGYEVAKVIESSCLQDHPASPSIPASGIRCAICFPKILAFTILQFRRMGPFTLRNHRYNRTLRSGIPDRPDRLRTIDEEDDEIVDAIGEDGVRGTHDTTKDPIVSTSSIQTDMDAVTYKITYSTLSLAAYAHLDSKVWHEEALAHTPTSISSLSLGPPNISIITDSKARLLPRIRLYMLRWLTRLITRCVTGRLATARRSSPR